MYTYVHALCSNLIIYVGGSYSAYDYYDGSYYVTIPAGKTIVPFNIRIFDDSRRESNEYFRIYIYHSSLPYYVFPGSFSEARVIIIDDDCE